MKLKRAEKTKFSLGNANNEEFTNKEWAYFQCSWYWVERLLMTAEMNWACHIIKLTGWLAWHHHMAFVLIASLYILNLKLEK
jgi:hypothetical protein